MLRNTALFILLYFLFQIDVAGQDRVANVDLPTLLLKFYVEVGEENAVRGLQLSKKIDSILVVEGNLDDKSFAIYNNAKGYIYNLNNLNPEPYLIKADSLNNQLSEPDMNIKVFSSFILGGFYYNKKEDVKAKKYYSKIISIEDLPEKFYRQKLKALDNTFFIERIELNNHSDSTLVRKTAKRLINFRRKTKDTLVYSFVVANEYLNKYKEAESVCLGINNIKKDNPSYNKYSKFLVLNWLNDYYYKSIRDSVVVDFVMATKLKNISKELLVVINGTDFMDAEHIYALYGDIVVASLITTDQKNLDLYESKILNLLDSSEYKNDNKFNLSSFYYTLHKLKMYFDIYGDYEKAKFYSLKNVELTKRLYGEISIQHEQELRSYESIIKLKMFDYDESYQISLKREHIIIQLFSEESTEYLEILFHQYHIFLTQFEFEMSLKIIRKALNISKKIKCDDEKLCNDIFLNYLEALNNNKKFKKVLNETNKLLHEANFSIYFRISKIRRNAYYELRNYHGINIEFEWVLDQINNKKDKISSNSISDSDYRSFLVDYQEHLRLVGRLHKAIDLSEQSMTLFNDGNAIFLANKWNLNYLNILLQLNKCSEVLKFTDNNEVLKFNDITTPQSRILDQNHLMNVLGRAHNCLGNFENAIESYQKIISQEELDQNHGFVWMEICLLYSKLGNKKQVGKYQKLFEKNLEQISDLNIDQLFLLIDFYTRIDNKDKIIEYMLPLSNKISHDICNKSFYSSNDNSNDRLLHEEALSLLLTLNQDEYFSNELSGNAQWISNLYKMKLDFFGQTNLDIQHLKNTNDPDAAQLKNLENRFNDFPSELLREEINQVKTKIINYRMSNYKQLCEVQFNEVLRSIKKNELVIDLISYYNRYDSAVSYALNSSNNGITFSGIDINFKRESDLKNRKDVNSYFFNYIYENIPQITSSTENSLDTFYIIPSGKSNFINFSALSLSLENKLGREITVHVINSLADIPKIKKEEEKKIDDFILIGDIDFDKTANNSSKNLKNQTRGIQLTTSIKDSGIPFWGYLPGTKQEIESIERIALDNNINTLILREKEVTQSKLNNFLLDRNKNNVIHIATHGYFFPDNSEAKTDNLFASHQNPLLRSGLILSGANDNWNNKSLVGSHNDGILTAEEISFLDLSGVELVVLSACDTGLGDVSNLEGINGLQRAFKLAGAKKLIMSLWKVPDKETAEFFKHFYKFLLEDERSINESFRYTQKIMNEKYEPYYWASFVLLE